jgi:bifunctional DNA-binding transcriptional regulator/antitoxin component of YhaV-PrlF toxin-antitoxin module
MTDNEIEDVEIRKVQTLTGERSFVLVLAKQFARELGISKGDFLKCYVRAGRLIVEKIDPKALWTLHPIFSTNLK